MCKFNHRLFNFTLIILLVIINDSLTSPANRKTNPSAKSFLSYDDYDQNYDIHYDQRQNGTENYRVNFNGFLIALPDEQASNKSDVIAAFEDDLFNLFDKYENEPLTIEELHGFDESLRQHIGSSDTKPSTEPHQPIATNSSSKAAGQHRNSGNDEKPNKPKKRMHFSSLLKLLRRTRS